MHKIIYSVLLALLICVSFFLGTLKTENKQLKIANISLQKNNLELTERQAELEKNVYSLKQEIKSVRSDKALRNVMNKGLFPIGSDFGLKKSREALESASAIETVNRQYTEEEKAIICREIYEAIGGDAKVTILQSEDDSGCKQYLQHDLD